MDNEPETKDSPPDQTRWIQAAVPERPPQGGYPIPKVADFAAVSEPAPAQAALEDGEVLVKHLFLSPDPYIVSLIMTKPANVGKTVWSGAVGRVVATRTDAFAVGDLVVGGGQMGAQEWSTRKPGQVFKFPAKEGEIPLSTALGVCGMPGVTAYIATRDILAHPDGLDGKTIVVTGAAGAVGSVAVQVAKIMGAAKVIGLAGTDEKCAHCISKFGVDHMLNYKSETLREDLTKLGPFHGFYDNTGGPAAILIKELLIDNAPVAKVGAIGGASESPDDARLSIQGFYAGGCVEKWPPAVAALVKHVMAGEIRYDETVLMGIGAVPEAFIRQRTGKQLGKMIVQLVDQ